MRKKQNTRRNIAECVQKIYSYGIFVTAGFIVGFDNEKGSIADAMAALIDDCAIPISIVGLLYALPEHAADAPSGRGRPPAQRPRRGQQTTTRAISARTASTSHRCGRCATSSPTTNACWSTVYAPEDLRGRLEQLVFDARPRRPSQYPAPGTADSKNSSGVDDTTTIINAVPETREIFWKTFMTLPAPIRARCATSCGSDGALHAPWPILAGVYRPRSTAVSPNLDEIARQRPGHRQLRRPAGHARFVTARWPASSSKASR